YDRAASLRPGSILHRPALRSAMAHPCRPRPRGPGLLRLRAGLRTRRAAWQGRLRRGRPTATTEENEMKRILPIALAAALVGTSGLAAPALAQDQDKISLVVNAVQIFGTIDPAKVNDYTEYMAIVNLYDALTTVDPTGNVVPQLAESWEVSDDSLTYTFKLKQDATFQDGSPVEAKDVVYSMQRLLAINEGPAYLFSGLVDSEN